MGPSEPEIFRGDFLAKLDHMCPKRKILPRGNYYSAWRGYFANLLFSPVFSIVCFCLYIYFYLTCSFLLAYRLSPKWDHLCPRYLEMIFFTRMGPSVPEILRGNVSPKWEHLCSRYLEMIFFTRMGPSVPEILRGNVSPKWEHLCSRYLEMIFFTRMGRDYLCPRYLEMIFHANGTICAQDI